MGAFGGAEVNVLLTATALRARGHGVALAHGPGTGKAEEEWRNVFGERFPLGTAAAADGATALAGICARLQPEVVFAHNVSEGGALQALAAHAGPVVRMVHDHSFYCMRGYKYNVVTRRICRRAASLFCVFPCGASLARGPAGGFPLRWVSYGEKRREIALNRRLPHLIVATDYMREELLRNGFAADQIEIHAPVPLAAPPIDPASFGARNRLVYAGQIVRGKGVDVLLESLARVTAPFECVIIGDGSHRPACERLRDRLGLRSRVEFTGFLPQAQIAGYYREASLAVMSSLWPEPFGATGLEAMRCGLPVVAFDAGGIREWLSDGVNGFLVPWLDRGIYAARIDALLRDKPLARRLGANGRQLAAERFGFTRYIDGLEDLLTRAALAPAMAGAAG